MRPRGTQPPFATSLVATLLVVGLLAACSAESTPGAQRSPDAPASVLLVTLDTTRFDAVGAHTPVLAELARESLVFENAHTVAPLTLPAHASLLTGLYPPRHGIRDNGHRPLPSSARTLAEVARESERGRLA